MGPHETSLTLNGIDTMGSFAEPVPNYGEQRAYHVAKWMAAFHSDSGSDHHFDVATVEVDRLFVASRSFSDDPVLRSMGSTVYLSRDRDLSVVQTISQSSDAVVVAK